MSTIKRIPIPGVAKIVTISSAKGGVGKSTTAVNVALALHRLGRRVALLDADVTGPSLPTMMHVVDERVTAYKCPSDNKTDRLLPPSNFGVAVMSMGNLVPGDKALAVRGPMINKYLTAMLYQTDWGDLDVLVVDMPPGTNDIHLTLAQNVGVDGAVIVSTPQQVALVDVRRGVEMFKRTDVRVLGLVENMAYFACTKCEERHYLFGEGGVRRMAAELGHDFLGEVPFAPVVLQGMDVGEPPAAKGDEALPHVAPYFHIARRITEKLAS